MTTGEALYLTMVIVGVLVFMATLAWAAHINPSSAPARDASAARSHGQGSQSAAPSR
jgi:hypothetical protein